MTEPYAPLRVRNHLGGKHKTCNTIKGGQWIREGVTPKRATITKWKGDEISEKGKTLSVINCSRRKVDW